MCSTSSVYENAEPLACATRSLLNRSRRVPMIYVVELLIDDGRRVLRFFEALKDATSLFDKAASPWTDGTAIKGGQGGLC